MDIEPFSFDVDSLSGRGSRGDGVHVSELIHFLDHKLHNTGEPQHWDHAALVGFMFEDSMRIALRDQVVRQRSNIIVPGELEQDGILLTPDGFDTVAYELWEFKATWRSCEKWPPESRWTWLVQSQAYCHVMGLDVANFGVLYLNGDYRPMQPRLVGTRFRFTPEELEANWRMILGSKDYYLRERQT